MLKYIYIFSKQLLSNFLKDLITSQLLAAEQFNVKLNSLTKSTMIKIGFR